MKRSILLIMLCASMLLSFSACNKNSVQGETIKIGIIDTSISKETVKKYKIENIFDCVDEDTADNDTHGSAMLNIITDDFKNYDIYYATALDCTYTGEIKDVVSSLDWCIRNNVDVICMSFATLKDDSNLKSKVSEAIEAGIAVVASCINYSDSTCYPAMYDGVISVSEGTNPNASIVIEEKCQKSDARESILKRF